MPVAGRRSLVRPFGQTRENSSPLSISLVQFPVNVPLTMHNQCKCGFLRMLNTFSVTPTKSLTSVPAENLQPRSCNQLIFSSSFSSPEEAKNIYWTYSKLGVLWCYSKRARNTIPHALKLKPKYWYIYSAMALQYSL